MKNYPNPVLQNAITGLERFLRMVRDHEGTDSSDVAERLICAVANDCYPFKLSGLRRFDSSNLAHALQILQAYAHYHGDLSQWLWDHHGTQVERLTKKVTPIIRSEAKDILQ